jgi:hypothetical protein
MSDSKWLEKGLEEAKKEFERLPQWLQGREPIEENSKLKELKTAKKLEK